MKSVSLKPQVNGKDSDPKNMAGVPGASLTTVNPTNHTTHKYTTVDIPIARNVPLGMADWGSYKKQNKSELIKRRYSITVTHVHVHVYYCLLLLYCTNSTDDCFHDNRVRFHDTGFHDDMLHCCPLVIYCTNSTDLQITRYVCSC